MNRFCKTVTSGALIAAFCLMPAAHGQQAQSTSGNLNFTGYKVGIVVGLVAVAAVVTIVVVHKHSGKRTVTGCVSSGGAGMVLLSDKDKQSYSLTGPTAALVSGDRMTVELKKMKDSTGSIGWELKKVDKDVGVCRP